MSAMFYCPPLLSSSILPKLSHLTLPFPPLLFPPLLSSPLHIQYQQQYLSVIIVLVFLLILPFIFDFLARHYEGMKLESEIQNSIMTRYFYYQVRTH